MTLLSQFRWQPVGEPLSSLDALNTFTEEQSRRISGMGSLFSGPAAVVRQAPCLRIMFCSESEWKTGSPNFMTKTETNLVAIPKNNILAVRICVPSMNMDNRF